MSEYKLLDEFEEQLTDDRITIKSRDRGILQLTSDSWDEFSLGDDMGKPSEVQIAEVNEEGDEDNYLDIRPVDYGPERFGRSPQEAVDIVENILLK